MWSTYALATPRGMATCVIVNRHELSAPNRVLPVLITSAHILTAAPHGPFYVVVRQQRPGRNPTIGVLEFTSDPRTQAEFFVHPSQDIAVLELHIPPELAADVSLPSFIDEATIARPGNHARVGDELLVLGFPHVFPGTEGAFAVLRSGKMASYSLAPASDREKFLINTTVFGGDSGAPVFAVDPHQKRAKLVGMISQRIGEKEAGVPLAVAVNASTIRETLDLESQGARVDVGPTEALAAAQPHGRSGVRLAGLPVPWSQSVLASFKPKPADVERASFASPTSR